MRLTTPIDICSERPLKSTGRFGRTRATHSWLSDSIISRWDSITFGAKNRAVACRCRRCSVPSRYSMGGRIFAAVRLT